MRGGLLFPAVVLVAVPLAAVTATQVFVVSGTTDEGAPTARWIDLVRRNAGEEAAASAAAPRRPPTEADRAWEALIRTRARVWHERVAALAAPFRPVQPPAAIWIVVGNRGANDAFTHDPTTIGFDVSRLETVYGPATVPENRARIDRFFDHETTHLMQKAWLAEHPWEPTTHFERAELGIWLEGMGNYYSLSERWRSPDGGLSATARAVLDELEPVLVERMTALACATDEEAERLTADLSLGPFTEKWGALPPALWLAAETSRDRDALREFVRAGPPAVRDLARRHLPPTLAARLDRARERSRSCVDRGE